MKKEVLEEVETQLAKVDKQIANLRDKFSERFTGEYTEETIRIEAEKIALQEWQKQLIATRESIAVMCDGGIMADAERKGKMAAQAAEADRKASDFINANAIQRFA